MTADETRPGRARSVPPPGMNVGHATDAPLRAVPDRVALVVDGRTVTYRELEHRIRQVEGALTAVGVGPGDRVALVNLGSVLSVATILGAARIGAASAQMNAHLTPGELGQLAELTGTRTGVAGDRYAVRPGFGPARPGPRRGGGLRHRGGRGRGPGPRGPGGGHRPRPLHQRHHRPAQAHPHQPPGGGRSTGLLRQAHRSRRPPGHRHDVGPHLPHRRHPGPVRLPGPGQADGHAAQIRPRGVVVAGRTAPGEPDLRGAHHAPPHSRPSPLRRHRPHLVAIAQLWGRRLSGGPGATGRGRLPRRGLLQHLRSDRDVGRLRRADPGGPPAG